MPNPRQRDSILLSVLLMEAPVLARETTTEDAERHIPGCVHPDDGFQGPRGRPPGFLIAQEEAARSSRQGKLTFARKVDTDLIGDRGDGVGGLGVTTPKATDTLQADDQDVGMQGAG
ncbi:predicted protein [Chaetomium globosum CBS 148.51]|uniref:Uncharacterized protein n=1 Tax=Chaetomium globosum (strain ATCC 6205 / CBS 148.51 / DSM 1962 / NBRC 6347 / NRRL 1970) TaxID=306901 RepID=Q2GTV2_CHAGB|nr:uncharacterized protein CHGG_08602 [Chaetomium globosum CBS 148.51]EAQ84588.1 predicted protein [Chaetomium globosum CBS 148.51]